MQKIAKTFGWRERDRYALVLATLVILSNTVVAKVIMIVTICLPIVARMTKAIAFTGLDRQIA